VSNSWGGELNLEVIYDVEEFAPFLRAIQSWIHGGIIPVFAAGNSGKSPNGFPGGLPEPIAVGAISPNGEIAAFSSRGPNLWKVGESVLTLLKPDISAPGEKIISAYPGNKYASMAGTSMATPHVTGAIALALQANPKLKFSDIKKLLLKSSEKKIDTQYGFGILNAYEFVKLAKSYRS
jgi:subtilisin family serine protease